MKLSEAPPTLKAILSALPMLVPVAQYIFLDNGIQGDNMEKALSSEGLTILVMKPNCVGIYDSTRTSVSLGYASTVWVRTNPNKKFDGVAKWDPLAIEEVVIPAVIKYFNPLRPGQQPFAIPTGLEPETDYTDAGCDTRCIRFLIQVMY